MIILCIQQYIYFIIKINKNIQYLKIKSIRSFTRIFFFPLHHLVFLGGFFGFLGFIYLYEKEFGFFNDCFDCSVFVC